MKFPDEILFRLAEQSQTQGKYREAIDILKTADPTKKRDDWLADLSYLSGRLDCAGNRWPDASVNFTRSYDTHPDKVKKDLSHQRLLWLKKRAVESYYGAEWMNAGRACNNCPGVPGLFSCATCSKYGQPMNEAERIGINYLSPVIDELWVPAAYRSGYDPQRGNPFSRLIRLAKRGNADKACGVLGHMLADYIDNHSTNLRSRVDLIIPVPTSRNRLKLRGYSIPVLLAESIGLQLCLPYFDNILILNHDTQETRGLNRYQKQQILREAFRISKPEYIKGLSILIVDDIMTTGTTLQYAAIAIKEFKPASIFAVVLAHTEHSWSWEEPGE